VGVIVKALELAIEIPQDRQLEDKLFETMIVYCVNWAVGLGDDPRYVFIRNGLICSVEDGRRIMTDRGYKCEWMKYTDEQHVRSER
jgi:hypothetical protein